MQVAFPDGIVWSCNVFPILQDFLRQISIESSLICFSPLCSHISAFCILLFAAAFPSFHFAFGFVAWNLICYINILHNERRSFIHWKVDFFVY